MSRGGRLSWVIGAVVLAAAPGGCGGSSPSTAGARAVRVIKPTGPCTSAARLALGGFIGVNPASITTVAGTSNSSYPQCIYRAGRVKITTILDTGPQPYFVLERTAIEAGQVFTPGRIVPSPTPITRLGIEAYWFPVEKQVMATDGKVLATVTVGLPKAKSAQRVALGSAIARTYLGAARAHGATGYPGG